MPYIGNTSADRFTASKAASVYSGDGSTTAFTLEHSVGSDEDILVSVDGVIQEPSVAYAVSSGTTLTFTAAPSTNSGNNIFVYYLFRTVGTVGHPSNQALSATNGTFSGNTTVAGTSTFTGDVTIGDASAADKKILFDGNAVDYHIGLDDSADSLIIGKGSALGTTTSMAIDANGIITKPLQPAFLATIATTADVTGNGDNYTLTTSIFTEVYDQNGDFLNGTFTAPITGKYHFIFNVAFSQIVAGDHNNLTISFVASNRTTTLYKAPGVDRNTSLGGVSYVNSVYVDMDTNDTFHMVVSIGGGAKQVDIFSTSTLSGMLVA
jgi:hypothetical protein